MLTYKQYKEKALKNPDFRMEYEDYKPVYEFARSLVKRRRERNMTQKALADKVHTKQSAISRLESGYYNPSLKLLMDIAKALNCKLVITLEPV